jgi:hypothetical protein
LISARNEPKDASDLHRQRISPKGNRCHLLIDATHRPSNGAQRPALSAYHGDRLRAAVAAVDPEAVAAGFPGNLVKPLAPKRITRRDAIAWACISR